MLFLAPSLLTHKFSVHQVVVLQLTTDIASQDRTLDIGDQDSESFDTRGDVVNLSALLMNCLQLSTKQIRDHLAASDIGRAP